MEQLTSSTMVQATRRFIILLRSEMFGGSGWLTLGNVGWTVNNFVRGEYACRKKRAIPLKAVVGRGARPSRFFEGGHLIGATMFIRGKAGFSTPRIISRSAPLEMTDKVIVEGQEKVYTHLLLLDNSTVSR